MRNKEQIIKELEITQNKSDLAKIDMAKLLANSDNTDLINEKAEIIRMCEVKIEELNRELKKTEE